MNFDFNSIKGLFSLAFILFNLLAIFLFQAPLYAEEGTLKWSIKLNDLYYDPHVGSVGIVTSPAIGDNGTIYIVSNKGTLFAVKPDGTEEWHYVGKESGEAGGSGYYSPSIGMDGTIYFKCGDGYLYAIDNSGQKIWSFQHGGTGGSDMPVGIAIGWYGEIILPEWKARAINPDGTSRWIADKEYYTLSLPGIGPDGTLYILSNLGLLRAINSTGDENWTLDVGSLGLPWVGIAISIDGTIYFGHYSKKKLYAINPNGSVKWEAEIDTIFGSPVIGSDGTIYVNSNVYLFAIDNAGNEKWKLRLAKAGSWGSGSTSSSPAIGADGTIFVVSYPDYVLKAINPDGTVKWEYPIGHGYIRSSPAIGSDGSSNPLKIGDVRAESA